MYLNNNKLARKRENVSNYLLNFKIAYLLILYNKNIIIIRRRQNISNKIIKNTE